MRYRTVIELVCEGNDEDEAMHTAGEYLRGKVDIGVDMFCATFPVEGEGPVRGSSPCTKGFGTA